MELYSHIYGVFGFLSLLVFYCVVVITSHTRKGFAKLFGIPEPPGGLPLIGHLHLLGGTDPVCRTLGTLADKYGSLFSLRVGLHRLLVVSNAEMVKEFLATNDRNFASRANIAVGRYMGYNNAMFALAPYGPYWRDMRKMVVLKLLSHERLEMGKHVPASEVESLIKELYSLSTDKGMAIISELFEHMTFNIILRKLIGKRFSSTQYRERNSEGSRIRRAITEALYLSGTFVLSDAIPSLEWMDFQGHIGSMKRTAKEIESLINIWRQEHLQKQSESKILDERDFMDVMLSKLGEDAVISGHTRDAIIKATTMILILTGAGSTSTTLTWAISLLLNNPKVLKAAQEELDVQVGKEKWVQESDIQNLNYLQAIIKETLRLYPPGPLTGLREAIEDCKIGDCFIPRGTRLVVNIWKVQRDPRVWSNPSEFQPERFMKNHEAFDGKDKTFEFVPFSYGRRSCPGVAYGMQVLHLALARVLQGFNISTMAGLKVDMREGLGISFPKVEPLEIVLKPRLPTELY